MNYTSQVRGLFTVGAAEGEGTPERVSGPAFDLWLATVKAEAWSEGWLAGNTDGYYGTRQAINPYA